MKKSTWFVLGILAGTYAMKKTVDAMVNMLIANGKMYYEIQTPKDEIVTAGKPIKEPNEEETSSE